MADVTLMNDAKSGSVSFAIEIGRQCNESRIPQELTFASLFDYSRQMRANAFGKFGSVRF